ncbi:uncharacterized protein LOC133924436 isoform X2 [Phragmites australis]|uniref:uncharacterized protein LOC133924436 isoform X2 n=1 Tax=Phragmites australis TaxID=29695 RepID=UPI002D77B990|nr:uncharacterized protein LOC133924436 isoform X2 [Phragmites australis]XP_062225942.1 uncharacterized protein LOC133924436 isoform X2 [Phragmites australis]
MDEEATTGGSRAAETFDPELIHAIFKLVWSRRGERGSGDGNEVVDVEIGSLLRIPREEIEVQLPMQVHLKSAVNFYGYLLQRLFNVLLLSLRPRNQLLLNPPI